MIGGRGFLITQYLGIVIHSWDSQSQTNHNEIHGLVGGLEHFLFFHNIWDSSSHWLIFLKMVKTTNQWFFTHRIPVIFAGCFYPLTFLLTFFGTNMESRGIGVLLATAVTAAAGPRKPDSTGFQRVRRWREMEVSVLSWRVPPNHPF